MYVVAAVAAGVVAAAALPPVDLSLLAVVGLAAGLVTIRCAPSRRAALAAAFGLGVGYFGAALSWSDRFGVAVWLVLVVSQAVFWLPTGWVAWSTRYRTPAMTIVTTAATATIVAAVRARVPLGGLEWAQLGVTAHASPVRSASALVGTLGVTALVVAVATSLAVAVGRPKAVRAWRSLVVTLVVVTVSASIGALPWAGPAGTLEVAVAQADPPCPGQAAVDCPGGGEQVRSQLRAVTDGLARTPDLIVWGESVLSAATPDAAAAELVERTGPLDAPLLVGVTSPVPGGSFFNRNVLVGRDGDVLGAYAKRQPVPFGEYVPARSILGRIQDVGRLVPRDMARGGPPTTLSLGAVELGTVSSWEVTFSRLVRDVAAGSHALVTLTTQATYGRAAVSDQLLRAAQLRAAELQRSVIIAATTGRSVVIGPGGALGPTTALYGADLLVDTVALRRGQTPFARFGDVPILVSAMLALILGHRRARRTVSVARRHLATMVA